MRNFLPGRPQSSRQALCTVNWDGLRLIAYISGSTIIIFNGRRDVLQSISVDEATALHSLSIDEQSGQIAASDGHVVYLYQPLGRDYGDLRWSRAHTLSSDASWAIRCLSWGSPDDLLVSGQQIMLWNLADEDKPQIIWSSDLSSPVEIALFSPDGGLIASCGLYDRIVKIWRRLSYEQDSTRFDVAYLPHPMTVTNLSWRQFWHQEQNMDNLLYTCCADGNVRVWAHTDHHALSVLQKIVTIDTRASIQPRRMSLNSMSKNRFSFVLHSRDLARATERAVQTARSGTDHALEHLVEVANRSPETCVVLDDLGHMSAWGIENVSSKSKASPEKFNVALVDGVNIRLPKEIGDDNAVQIVAFANSDAAASLCILVHSFTGQIDWYQGSFVSFFDTGAHQDRLDFQACWSGHDSVIDKMISSPDRRNFLSLTETDQVIYWSQTETETPVRVCDTHFDSTIIDATFLDDQGHVAVLQNDEISIWMFSASRAKSLGKCLLGHKDPLTVSCLGAHNSEDGLYLIVLFEDNRYQVFDVHLADQTKQSKANGYHKAISSSRSATLPVSKKSGSICFGVPPSWSDEQSSRNVLVWSDSGDLEICTIHGRQQPTEKLISSVRTHSAASNIAALYNNSLCAVVHADYRTITIWNSAQSSCEWTSKFMDYDHIQQVHWFSVSDVPILIIQFAYYIVVVAPRQYDTEQSSWTLHQVIQTRQNSSHIIGSLCWLEPNQIAVGTGGQIMTFEIDGAASVRLSSNADLHYSTSVEAEQSIQLQNSSFALYSPECLARYLAAGNLHVPSAILSQIYEELRFLTTGGEMQFDVSQILEDIDLTYVDLSEIKSHIKESLTKVSGVQLQSKQKERLQQLVDITDELAQNFNSMDQFALSYLYHFLQVLDKTEDDYQVLRPLSYAAIVSASLSKTQEALLHYVLATLERHKIKLTWSTARSLGIFLFLEDDENLKLHFESVARAEYNRNPDDKNPVDCSLYYLALDKKAILQSLWRRTLGMKEKESTMKLLAHDFKDAKWRATALKNAYALLSRRRFEYAAAFFLLGGSLIDAVNVCVNQLHDFQLGVAITRVWAGDAADKRKVMDNLIDKMIPALAVRSHEAKWMLLWSRIRCRDWPGALRCITKPTYQTLDKQIEAAYAEGRNNGQPMVPLEAMYFTTNDPTLLINLYTYSRQQLYDQSRWTSEIVDEVGESQFVMRSAKWYSRAGLDWLALKLVTGWKFLDAQIASKPGVVSNGTAVSVAAEPKSMLDEWMMPEDSITPQRNDTRSTTKDEKPKPKPAPTQFIEPSADSLLDSFGF